jgi:hypothetical protein
MALSPGTSPETDAAIQALQGQIAAVENHNATLREQLAKAEDRAERAEERADKAEQRLIDELARLAAQNHPPTTDFALPDAALEAIRADLESEELPSNELPGPSDSGQRTRLAEALDIIRKELDGPMSNEQVPSAASAKPGRLDGVAAIRSEVDGNDEEEGRGSDDQAAVVSAPLSESKSESAAESRRIWWSRFVPRWRRRTL